MKYIVQYHTMRAARWVDILVHDDLKASVMFMINRRNSLLGNSGKYRIICGPETVMEVGAHK